MTDSINFKTPMIGFILNRSGVVVYFFKKLIIIGDPGAYTHNACISKTKLSKYLRGIHKREMDGMCGIGQGAKYSPNVVIEIIDAVEAGLDRT
ncbi:MAG: hypothetical protein A4E42_00451 [Methanoregulaceae archaeon PtaU1.Bin222]|nr:MAG: hypothetical protein A4E42_00451 [Methanoregulaceae archaeon PtaU1.Bin222]